METLNYERLTDVLVTLEGVRYRPYLDTLGNLTIGVGHKIKSYEHFTTLDKNGVRLLLFRDIQDAIYVCRSIYENYDKLPSHKREFMIIMAFNLGNRLSGFKKMNRAIIEGNEIRVMEELYNSKWREQVGYRRYIILISLYMGANVYKFFTKVRKL